MPSSHNNQQRIQLDCATEPSDGSGNPVIRDVRDHVEQAAQRMRDLETARNMSIYLCDELLRLGSEAFWPMVQAQDVIQDELAIMRRVRRSLNTSN